MQWAKTQNRWLMCENKQFLKEMLEPVALSVMRVWMISKETKWKHGSFKLICLGASWLLQGLILESSYNLVENSSTNLFLGKGPRQWEGKNNSRSLVRLDHFKKDPVCCEDTWLAVQGGSRAVWWRKTWPRVVKRRKIPERSWMKSTWFACASL